jgi:hypothetical protein
MRCAVCSPRSILCNHFPLTPPHISMKKFLIAVAALGTLGLAACSDDKKADDAGDHADHADHADGDSTAE